GHGGFARQRHDFYETAGGRGVGKSRPWAACTIPRAGLGTVPSRTARVAWPCFQTGVRKADRVRCRGIDRRSVRCGLHDWRSWALGELLLEEPCRAGRLEAASLEKSEGGVRFLIASLWTPEGRPLYKWCRTVDTQRTEVVQSYPSPCPFGKGTSVPFSFPFP